MFFFYAKLTVQILAFIWLSVLMLWGMDWLEKRSEEMHKWDDGMGGVG